MAPVIGTFFVFVDLSFFRDKILLILFRVIDVYDIFESFGLRCLDIYIVGLNIFHSNENIYSCHVIKPQTIVVQ